MNSHYRSGINSLRQAQAERSNGSIRAGSIYSIPEKPKQLPSKRRIASTPHHGMAVIELRRYPQRAMRSLDSIFKLVYEGTPRMCLFAYRPFGSLATLFVCAPDIAAQAGEAMDTPAISMPDPACHPFNTSDQTHGGLRPVT